MGKQTGDEAVENKEVTFGERAEVYLMPWCID
jgi:hypothetical protein